MLWIFAILAVLIFLIYLVEKIRFRRRCEALSRLSFRPHTNAQGEFMCFCMTPRASAESVSVDDLESALEQFRLIANDLGKEST